jgi:hypothetical protein
MFLYNFYPLNSFFFNAMEIFNECCLIVSSYVLIEFSDYEEDPEFRYKIGWLMVFIMGLNVIVNWLCIFGSIGYLIYGKIKNKFCKNKNLKEPMKEIRKYSY